MLLSLAHTSIRVKDLGISRNFYEHTLGLDFLKYEENERLKFAFFKIGDTEIELLQLKNNEYEKRNDGPIDHIAFIVDNLQKEIIKLREKNVVFLMEDVKEVLDYKIIFIKGPDGERIELMERIYF